MILFSKLLPMGNNLLGKIIIARVVIFFREIIARVTQYKKLLPSLLLLKNAQTSWARKRSWDENKFWLRELLEYKQF